MRITLPRLAAVVLGGLAAAFGPVLTPTASAAPFATTSPFNTAVKASPAVDPNSAAMVARATRAGMVHANLYEYAIPVYTATSTTPTYSVSCSMSWAWGTCPLAGKSLPIPTNAYASTGSDGAMVVLDANGTTATEYWQVYRSGAGWRASWGNVTSLSGNGWSGTSTGSGASRLGGVIRVSEIQAGVINHALAVQSDTVCPTFRAPATKSDGTSTRSDCLPEGTRLQLDPSVNLNAIAGLSKAEKAVAKALQVYGAYVVDYGGAPLSISFERATDGTASSVGAVYAGAGMRWDYYGLTRVPWSKLRVLSSWNG